jgi:hypothetical protein
MKIETFAFTDRGGWSVEAFPALDSDRTLVTVFGASRFLDQPGPVRDLLAAYPSAHVVGCSTAGEILDGAIDDDSLSVAVCRFAGTTLRAAAAPVPEAAASYQAGRRLADRLLGPDLRGVLLFSDGIHVNGSELLRGLNELLPAPVIVTGGLAGDGDRFQRTWVVARGGLAEGAVGAVGLYGDRVRISHGSKGGWDTFGPERVVTRSAGNVLHEIDGRPALALYKEYLGERAAGLPGAALLFPLSLRRSRQDDQRLVRTILSIDEGAQTMTFAGDVPQGSLAQLMRASFDRLIEGAAEAGRQAARGADPSAEGLAIAISCVGRRLALGQRAEEEVEAVREALPEGARMVGCYAYGEIAPRAGGPCELQNQTMTLTHIGER